jgi:AraC family transcriptional regulator of adaptative response / DNA-3-methyladenine glycosylase II
LALRLPFAPPLAYHDLLDRLAGTAIPGVESVEGGWYRRTITVAGDAAAVEIGPGGPSHLEARFHLPHWEGLLHLVQRARRLFSLDVELGELAAGSPGWRVPGTWDPFELAVAWLANHDQPAERRDVMRQLVEAHGVAVTGLGHWQLTHLFPAPSTVASASLAGLGLSAAAQRRIALLAGGIAEGAIRLDRSLGRHRLEEELAPIGALASPLAAELSCRLGQPPIWPDAAPQPAGQPTGRATMAS